MIKDKRQNPFKDSIQFFAQAMLINNINTSATKIHNDFISHLYFLNESKLIKNKFLYADSKINVRTVQRIVKEIKNQFSYSYYEKSQFFIWNKNYSEDLKIQNPDAVLRANYISSILFGRNLWDHESKWVDKLAPFTKKLDPIPSLILSKEYSLREEYHFIKTGNTEIKFYQTYDLDKIISLQPWENKIKEEKLKNILFYPTLIMSPFNTDKFKKIKTWIIFSLNHHKDKIEFNSSFWNDDGKPISWNTVLDN
ncbi:MAG: hypothetical protein CL764_01705 [Chloroflexi bacterium]|nr:hypothetical protein [Chloroflexota bacterium]|tara:strand:+ start:2279 stop:3037 length:759 start_codon:yes stop_codon:yes gene_type:complete